VPKLVAAIPTFTNQERASRGVNKVAKPKLDTRSKTAVYATMCAIGNPLTIRSTGPNQCSQNGCSPLYAASMTCEAAIATNPTKLQDTDRAQILFGSQIRSPSAEARNRKQTEVLGAAGTRKSTTVRWVATAHHQTRLAAAMAKSSEGQADRINRMALECEASGTLGLADMAFIAGCFRQSWGGPTWAERN